MSHLSEYLDRHSPRTLSSFCSELEGVSLEKVLEASHPWGPNTGLAGVHRRPSSSHRRCYAFSSWSMNEGKRMSYGRSEVDCHWPQTGGDPGAL